MTLPSLPFSPSVWVSLMSEDKLYRENKPGSSARLQRQGPGIKLYTLQLGVWRCGKIAPFDCVCVCVWCPMWQLRNVAEPTSSQHHTNTSGPQGLTLKGGGGEFFCVDFVLIFFLKMQTFNFCKWCLHRFRVAGI